MIGQKSGRLTVLARAGSDRHQNALIRCVCDCGKTSTLRASAFRTGKTQSCGCLRLERSIAATKKSNTRHGMKRTPEYRTWGHMRGRCLNPSDRDWPDYGGRGIVICERWLNSFEAFSQDMGLRPTPTHSIDRIDVNGNYEPGNCRWATPTQQSRNRRFGQLVTIGGSAKRVSEWAAETGIPASKIYRRLSDGWSAERALER
jgi:hypothetical protein